MSERTNEQMPLMSEADTGVSNFHLIAHPFFYSLFPPGLKINAVVDANGLIGQF